MGTEAPFGLPYQVEIIYAAAAILLFFVCCVLCWICACFCRKFKITKRKDDIPVAAATEGDGADPKSPASAASPSTELSPVPASRSSKRESYKAFHVAGISTAMALYDQEEAYQDKDDIDDQVVDGIITKMATGDMYVTPDPDPDGKRGETFRHSMKFSGDDFKDLEQTMKAMNVITKSLSNVMIDRAGTSLNEDDQKVLQEAWAEDGATPSVYKKGDKGPDVEAMDGYVDTGAQDDVALDLILENGPKMKSNGVK